MRPRPLRAPVLALCCLPSLASRCKDGDDSVPPEDTGPTADVFWETTEVLGVPNIDDDDENGAGDWDDAARGDDDDLAALTVPSSVFTEVGALTVTLAGEGVRIWLDGAVLLDAEHTEATLAGPDAAHLRVEFQDFLDAGSLGFSGGERTSAVALLASPLILNHHLQASTHLYVMGMAWGGYSNADMVADLQEILGEDRVTVAPAGDFGQDVWIQDEIEFARASAPGLALEVILDSIRSQQGRYLDHFATDYLIEPGVARVTWGSGTANSLDSFGNLETAPPTVADGVEYPLGRIYNGGAMDLHPTAALWSGLLAQGVQAPFRPDSTWLCVGHVDEFSALVPDPGSERGFKLLVTDSRVAYGLLDTLDPAMEIPKYASTHGYSTVGELVDDQALRDWNEDIQLDHIEPELEQYVAELGLTEEDVIRVPGIWEENAWCRDYALALIPGMINFAVFTEAEGPARLLIADPFLRPDEDDPDSDALIAFWDSLMPAGIETWYLDDWEVYHEGWGEVHCGTNIRREPGADWWDVARHLIGGEE